MCFVIPPFSLFILPFHWFPLLSFYTFAILFHPLCLSLSSQTLLFSQCLFDSWLTQKEEAVGSIQTANLKDQTEMVACLRHLAVSITELL